MAVPSYGQTYQGLVWDPSVGGYVSPVARQRQLDEAAGRSAGIRGTNTSTDISLRDAALREKDQEFRQQQTLAKNAALAAIAAQLQSSTGYSAGGGDVGGMGRPVSSDGSVGGGGATPEDLAAENASYGRGKERTGLAMQSAMKGLRGSMAARGITGSGIDAAAQGEVYGAGVGALSDIDAQLAETGANRAFTRSESAKSRAESGRQFDQSQHAQRLSQLIQLYNGFGAY